MSNEQRELFALMKWLHSVSVYFLLKSQAPTVSEERNEIRLQDMFVIDRFFQTDVYFVLSDTTQRSHTSNPSKAIKVIHIDCIEEVEQI